MVDRSIFLIRVNWLSVDLIYGSVEEFEPGSLLLTWPMAKL